VVKKLKDGSLTTTLKRAKQLVSLAKLCQSAVELLKTAASI